MRKIAHIAFSLYFVTLLIMPCADRQDCNEFKQTRVSQAAHQEQHADEMCTPFCVCSCCASHVLVTSISRVALTSDVATVHTIHPSPNLRGAIIPIWQPPKIA